MLPAVFCIACPGARHSKCDAFIAFVQVPALSISLFKTMNGKDESRLLFIVEILDIVFIKLHNAVACLLPIKARPVIEFLNGSAENDFA